VFQNRAFIVQANNAIGFSLPGNPSSPTAFSEGLFEMTVPTSDQVVAVRALDTRVVILCAESMWFVNADTFLDATGAGDIPTPLQLPITHGCTGFVAVVPQGAIYASSAGGFYLLGRDLTSTYIGSAVEDEMVGANVISVVTDQNQRVYLLTDTNKILVFDITFNGFFIYTPPTTALLLAIWKGQLVYSDGTDMFLLTAGQVADNPAAVDQAIITTAAFEAASFADSQVVWDLDFFCSGGTAYSLTFALTYDLDTSEPDVFPTFAAADMDVDGNGRARFNVPVTQIESDYIQWTLTDSFPGGPGPGFILDKIVAAVGVLPGKRRGNQSQRVQA
jgi:hypothetical protein